MEVRIDRVDESLSDYTRLTDVALRKKLETERGLFMAESSNVIKRAIDAGYRPRSFLMAERHVEDLRPWIEKATGSADGGDVPIYLGEETVLEQVTGFHLHRGALAAMNRNELPSVEEIVHDARLIVILEGIVDHTNVGAIFRSCAALGADGVLVTSTTADPLYRRAVRVSMGTVFQVPWTRLESYEELVTARQAGLDLAALALTDESVSLVEWTSRLGPDSRIGLLLGSEGDGLTRRAIGAADATVRIPMAGGVDSLNVAAASAVAVYAVRNAIG